MSNIDITIDKFDQIKAKIRLDSGKEINIEANTNPNDLTLLELEDANKKLSELIKVVKEIQK